MSQARREVSGVCVHMRVPDCACAYRDGGRRESCHLCPPGARRQPLSSEMSGSYLGCSFRREINDLVKASHALRCGLGPSRRSCSAEPFYKPATIYTPNEVLINCRCSSARRRPGKHFLLIKHMHSGLSRAYRVVRGASWPCIRAQGGGGGMHSPLVWGLYLLLLTRVCAPGLWILRVAGASGFSWDSCTLGDGLLACPRDEPGFSHCCPGDGGLETGCRNPVPPPFCVTLDPFTNLSVTHLIIYRMGVMVSTVQSCGSEPGLE